MFKPLTLFDESPILTPQQFLQACETFAIQSNFLYSAWHSNGVDRFPAFPLAVQRKSSNLIYIMGLTQGHGRGKVLLQGVSRIRGYRDLVYAAFILLPKDPKRMTHEARLEVLEHLGERLNHTLIILASNAGLEPRPEPSGEDHADSRSIVLPGVPKSEIECAAGRFMSNPS